MPSAPARARASSRLCDGAVARGHAHAEHLRRPERGRGQAGGQRRVDAAGEADHRGAEAALPHVVAHPEGQGPEELVGLGVVRHAAAALERGGRGRNRLAVEAGEHRPAPVQVDRQHHLLEERGARQHLAAGRHQHGAAVEEQRVVAADLVDVGDGHAVTAGRGGQHPLPQRRLAQRVGRGREVGHQPRPRGHQLAHRIAVVPRPLPEALVVPDVLADREPQRRLQARHGGGGGAAGGEEVAGLVEDVVGGEQRLAADGGHAAAGDERHRVHQPRRGRARDPFGEADQQREAPGPVARGGQLGQRGRGPIEELRQIEQIARWVAAERQLGEDHQRGALGPGPPGGAADQRGVALEVPDRRVDLRQGDASGGHVPG